MTTHQRLDSERIAAQSFLNAFEQHGVLASTQDRAHEYAAQPAARLPFLVVADRQTAGRGRGGNRWFTGGGSLAMSLAFDPAQWGSPGGFEPRRSLAAALAVIDAVEPWTPGIDVGLHWPNDVFCDQRKLAGILIDALPDGRLVLGVGINTNNRFDEASDEVRRRAVSLIEVCGRGVDHEQLILLFLERLGDAMRLLASDSHAFWLRCQELCRQIGRELTMRNGDETVSGRCAGIDPDGAICLETATGRRKFYSGVLVHSFGQMT